MVAGLDTRLARFLSAARAIAVVAVGVGLVIDPAAVAAAGWSAAWVARAIGVAALLLTPFLALAGVAALEFRSRKRLALYAVGAALVAVAGVLIGMRG